MSLVAGGVMLVPRQGRRERSYSVNTGATEDAALGASSAARRHRLHFVKPS